MPENRYIPLTSTVPGAVPTASGLYQGELALNVTDGRLYTRSGSQIIVLNPPSSGSSTFPYTGSAGIQGTLTVDGNLTANLLYGTLNGTASWAISSSTTSHVDYADIENVPALLSSSAQVDYTQIQNKPTTISTASYVDYANVVNRPTLVSSSEQINTGSFSGSFDGNLIGTSSWANNAITASYVRNTDLLNGFDSTVFATTGSNIFLGNQVITGSVSILNNLTVFGSTSVQYVTSSQVVISSNKIILNDDDTLRFAGISIYDSGSVSPSTASIYWDSLNHKFLYENLSTAPYKSAWFIAGPKNTGTLGQESGLVAGRVPVATDDDHIDTDPASSSIYIDFTTKKTFIEAGLYVTGSVTASAYTGSFIGSFIGIHSGSTFGTASWAVNSVSSSVAVTASYVSSAASDWSTLSGKPAGLVSSSAQTIAHISGQIISPAGISSSNNIIPTADNTYDLGSPSYRWANLYTGDLNLSNEGSLGNDIDGTTGNWTIQEGNDYLYIINNKNGKKFKIMLEEIE